MVGFGIAVRSQVSPSKWLPLDVPTPILLCGLISDSGHAKDDNPFFLVVDRLVEKSPHHE